MFTNNDFSWLKEEINCVDKCNWIYKVCTFIMRRKWTFGEYYAFIKMINRTTMGDYMASRFAFDRVMEVYKFQNNRYPIDMKHDK